MFGGPFDCYLNSLVVRTWRIERLNKGEGTTVREGIFFFFSRAPTPRPILLYVCFFPFHAIEIDHQRKIIYVTQGKFARRCFVGIFFAFFFRNRNPIRREQSALFFGRAHCPSWRYTENFLRLITGLPVLSTSSVHFRRAARGRKSTKFT